MLLQVVLYALLDLPRRVQFIGKLGSVDKVRVDLGEIHHREIEPRELVERKPLAGLTPRLSPRLIDLLATLLLEDAAEFGLKAAIRVPARDADAQHPI